MAVNFDAPEFTELTRIEKKDIVIHEYQTCRNDFEYYLDNYAFIRHPNKGILKMQAFDFQKDVAIPIATTLLNKRSAELDESLKLYKHKYDYEKWWKNLCEEKIELSKRVPPEFHNFHRIAAKEAANSDRVDTILLKSRQTGLSTIFQQLCDWHINFHGDVYDLIMSQGDREAIKFMSDIQTSFEEIPAPLRAKKINGNEHELWLSVTGSKRRKSGIQALPPTAKAGRSYSPNLVILDEFAEYRNAETVWTAVSMSVSAGGVIVIIATPKGVGNLYHKMWEMTNKSFSITMSGDNRDKASSDNIVKSVFRPHVVHWSQLPEEEFTRRGFRDAVEWYEHMKAKLMIEKGTAGVAQELDLNFLSSGNTIDNEIIERLRTNSIEAHPDSKIIQLDDKVPGLLIYELPEHGSEYVVGVDTGEGVRQDFSVLHVLKVADEVGTLVNPTPVAYFSSNTHSVRQFSKIVKNTGILYNNAWLNIERNNHGNVLLAYFVEDNEYNPDRVLNRYDSIKNIFVKGVKGWNSIQASRSLLVASFLDYIINSNGEICIPLPIILELKTFVLNQNKSKWEALNGYHDDHIISFALSLMTAKLLTNYKRFLIDTNEGYAGPNEIEDDILVGSSSFKNEENRKTFIETQRNKQALKPKIAFDPSKYKQTLEIEGTAPQEIMTKRAEKNIQGIDYKFIAQREEDTEYEEDDIYDIPTF